ncbi:Xaa-Pro peptidase family protein [Bacillus sp. 03113]|uniref:M24 family metallopeptidase n=1 Tax=Bacillus sp. 03113 TaxID=2578211 RepID=UPI001142EA3E|nr:Xaa-Pro peptidase family protein [Bacillus sp. 03113]
MQERLTHLSNWMKLNEIQVSFLTSTENVFYFSQFYSDPHERLLAIVLFQNDDPILVCPGMEKEEAKKAGWPYLIIGYSDTDHPWELIEKEIKIRVSKIERIAIEKEHMNVERYEKISALFPNASILSAEGKIRELRMIKDKSELEKIRKACTFADYAIEIGCQEIKEGKTELDVLASIEYELKKKGISKMSFSTMVLTGANAASPHGSPGNTKIQKGDLVLFDLGVVVEGYCSDITRTVAYGDINEQQLKIYDTVLKAQLAAIKASTPGIACSDIDTAARNVIREAGYGEFFPHRLGHGLGISIHEFPSLTETNPLLLQEGMVFTIEPGIYVPEVAGVRIEDDVLVTKDGLEVLTQFPKELQIIS